MGYFRLYKNDELTYMHNPLKLAESSGLNDLMIEDQRRHIDLRMPINIEARYPDEKHEVMKTLNAERAQKIYKHTKELVQWIRKSMKK